MKKYIYIAVAIVFLGISGYGVAFHTMYETQKKENVSLKKQLSAMNVNYTEMAKSLDALLLATRGLSKKMLSL